MSSPAKRIQKIERKHRVDRASQKRIESALKIGNFSELTGEELCRAWLESYRGLNDVQLLALTEGLSEPEAMSRLRAVGYAAGLRAEEIELVAEGRLELLSDEALEKLLAAL